MDLSLVICTRNRAARLAEALPYLARLKTAASWEIVFVDNASGDATREVLAAFVQSSGVNVTVIEEPRVGVSVAKNAGWRQSRGDVVAFTDDDCYPAEDYLDQIGRCFSEAEIGYLGGRVLLFDPGDYPITIQPLDRRVDIPPRSFLRTGMIHGANFAFRRKVLESVGGFDERLGPGTRLLCAEDVDILGRASAHGLAGAYDPRPLIFHHHRRRHLDEVNQLMATYDVGRGAYYAKALMDRRMRGTYFWPVLRRVGGNIWRRDFAVLRRELHGAATYIFG